MGESLHVPGGDVGVVAVGARGAGGGGGRDVVIAVVAGAALVLVGAARGVGRHRGLLEIRPVPRGHVGVLHQRRQAGRRRRVGADVEPVLVERGHEQLDLRPGCGHLALAHAAEEARADEAGDEPEDDDDHQQLDQGEAALVAEESSDRHGPPHRGRSVTERMAISMATTMKPTTRPMTRMMQGSANAISRLTSLRVPASSEAATCSSVSSSRPVSSPTRTMWTARAGNVRVSAMGWARPTPRRTPSPRLPTARASTWLLSMSLTTVRAGIIATPLLSSVPRMRVKRATTVWAMTWPASGRRHSNRPGPRPPPGGASTMRLPSTPAPASSPTRHQ